MKYKLYRSNHGFSLLEVLVAATIIIVLTAVGVTSYTSITRKSRDARRASDIEQVRQALEMYRSEKGFYPKVNTAAWGDLSALGAGANSIVPTYMPKLPVDPQATTTTPYQYIATDPDATSTNYYGYCIAANFENLSATSSTCSVALSTGYDYAVRHP